MFKQTPFLFLMFFGCAFGSLHFDATGGFSIQSAYRYYATTPEANGSNWLTFNPINNFCSSSRFSVDIWQNRFRFGISGGFLRRYELESHSRNNDEITSDKTGEILSIPLFGYIEGRHHSFFYEFGLGPYITRFNYTASDLPQYTVSPLFGFLFGGGYEHQLIPGLYLQLKSEMFVNAPVFPVDHLDNHLTTRIAESRYTEYNVNDFQTVLFNASISLGVQYEFGRNIRIPLDDAYEFIMKSDAISRFKRILPGHAE